MSDTAAVAQHNIFADLSDEEQVGKRVDAITALLTHNWGHRTEMVGSAVGGEIVNVFAANGDYLYTLTITRTP